MAKVLVLYHSSWGHVERLAEEVAAGARAVEGVTVDVKRVPETMPEDSMRAAGMKIDQSAPIATPSELADYDAIIFGTPTRFGNMSGQMRTFLDQTGGLWAKGALVGKIGGVFVATGTIGGGQETTAMSFITTLLHHGMVIVGPSYAAAPLNDISEVRGGSPYAAGAIVGPRGDRTLSDKEAEVARFQGRRIAELAQKLFG